MGTLISREIEVLGGRRVEKYGAGVRRFLTIILRFLDARFEERTFYDSFEGIYNDRWQQSAKAI